MAVGLGKHQIEPWLKQIRKLFPVPSISVACINSPKSTTLSGDRDQIHAMSSLLKEQNIFARILRVEVAYHSQHITSIAAEYNLKLSGILCQDPAADSPMMVSSVTGKPISSDQLCSPGYWVRNLVSPVLFSTALATLCNTLDLSAIVEIGPHSALQGPVKETLEEVSRGQKIDYHSCILRGFPASRSMFDTLGSIFCRGVHMDLREINQQMKTSTALMPLQDLPGYRFDHSKTFWKEGRLSKESRFRRWHRLDLLGKPVVDYNPLEPRWRNFLKVSEMPWTKSHEVCASSVPLTHSQALTDNRSLDR